jgi:hypothetical protein
MTLSFRVFITVCNLDTKAMGSPLLKTNTVVVLNGVTAKINSQSAYMDEL